MAVILALEPDHRQAAILKKIVTQDVHATLDVVDSRDAAMSALTARVPDVILLTALMSPRDEEDLIAHLRTLEGVEHVQTHTIPMLAGPAPEEAAAGSGLFGRLRRKKEPEAMAGCDPSTFAEEIRSYLARAAELKAEAVAAAESILAWAPPAAVETPRTDAQIWEEEQRAAAEAAERERERARREAEEAERERLRLEAEEAHRRAAEAEARRWEEEQRRREAEEAAERELAELEAQMAAERAREEERLRAEEEQRRREVEDAAERQRLLIEAEAAAQRAHEAERERLAEEARRREAEEAAERQRLLREAEVAADRARELERQQFEEERRQRQAEEAAARERLMREKSAASERARQAERARLEEERQRREAEERAERERLLREAEIAAERARELERERLEEEQRRIEAAQLAEREALLREAEEMAQQAMEAERRQQEEEQRRRAAQESAERERQLREQEKAAAAERRTKRDTEKKKRAATPPVVAAAAPPKVAPPATGNTAGSGLTSNTVVAKVEPKPSAPSKAAAPRKRKPVVSDDPFADFRAVISGDSLDSILRLTPVSDWAKKDPKRSETKPAEDADAAAALLAKLRLPVDVAGLTYASGCRIRRVRVPAAEEAPAPTNGPVIVSRRTLSEIRGAGR